MNRETFNKIVEETHAKSCDVLIRKNEEYSRNDDVLHAFEQASVLQGVSPEMALGGMMTKHTTSIYDMLHNPRSHSLEQWDEKILDHINYLILLRAVLYRNTYGMDCEGIATVYSGTEVLGHMDSSGTFTEYNDTTEYIQQTKKEDK